MKNVIALTTLLLVGLFSISFVSAICSDNICEFSDFEERCFEDCSSNINNPLSVEVTYNIKYDSRGDPAYDDSFYAVKITNNGDISVDVSNLALVITGPSKGITIRQNWGEETLESGESESFEINESALRAPRENQCNKDIIWALKYKEESDLLGLTRGPMNCKKLINNLPDLSPVKIDISIPDGVIFEGDNIYVSVSVKNLGLKSIQPDGQEWKLVWYLDGAEIRETELTYAPVGEDTAFGDTFWINNLNAGRRVISVLVDGEDDIEERDEGNNKIDKIINVESNTLKMEYLLIYENTGDYDLYVTPTFSNTLSSDIYITAGFLDLGESGGANRVKSWSNHPQNANQIRFEFDEDLTAYSIGTISQFEYSEFNTLSIELEIGNSRRKWEIPLEQVKITKLTRKKPNEETGPIDIPESPKEIEVEEVLVLCGGCLENNKCYPYGFRKDGQFCSAEDDKFISQLEEGLVCENHFECSSNVCVSGECVSPSLIEKILNWFKRLFGL